MMDLKYIRCDSVETPDIRIHIKTCVQMATELQNVSKCLLLEFP